jgi:hypothetical protein
MRRIITVTLLVLGLASPLAVWADVTQQPAPAKTSTTAAIPNNGRGPILFRSVNNSPRSAIGAAGNPYRRAPISIG